MLEAFQDWIRDNGARFKELLVAIKVWGPTQGHPEYGMSAALVAGSFEANIRIYEEGSCDIIFVDWDLARSQPDRDTIEVSYYHFQSLEEMRGVLEQLVDRMVSKPDPGG